MRRWARLLPLVALVAASLALGLGACRDDDDGGGGGASASETEQAFLEAMIPHHELAVEMAEVAQERGQHREIKRLADAIIATQTDEISQMERIHKRIFGTEVTPDPEAHEELGLSADEAGMHEAAAAELERAKPFDRAFIDEMVPHHRGAIRMAEAVLEETDDTQIEQLADAIISAQTREIGDMNEWRERWYGAPVEENKGEESGSMEEHEEH